MPKFRVGQIVECVRAPWHDHSEECGLMDYGPTVNEPVTVDDLYRDENGVIYIRFVEYLNDPNDAGCIAIFREEYFDHLNVVNDLTNVLFDVMNYDKNK